MNPSLVIHNVAYRRLANQIGRSQCILRNISARVALPHLNNLLLIQRGFSMRFPAGFSGAALARHVLRVLFSGSNKKMGRIAAWWVVTFMADGQPAWNGAVRLLPRYAMRATPSSQQCESAISCRRFRSRPFPTFSKLLAMGRNWAVLIDFRPEPFTYKDWIAHLGRICRSRFAATFNVRHWHNRHYLNIDSVVSTRNYLI